MEFGVLVSPAGDAGLQLYSFPACGQLGALPFI